MKDLGEVIVLSNKVETDKGLRLGKRGSDVGGGTRFRTVTGEQSRETKGKRSVVGLISNILYLYSIVYLYLYILYLYSIVSCICIVFV